MNNNLHLNITRRLGEGYTRKGQRITVHSTLPQLNRYVKKVTDYGSVEELEFITSIKSLNSSRPSVPRDTLIGRIGVKYSEILADPKYSNLCIYFYNLISEDSMYERYRFISKLTVLNEKVIKQYILDLENLENKGSLHYHLASLIIESFKLPNTLFKDCLEYFTKTKKDKLYLYFVSQHRIDNIKNDKKLLTGDTDLSSIYRYLTRVVRTRKVPRLKESEEIKILNSTNPHLKKLYVEFLNSVKEGTEIKQLDSFNKDIADLNF